MPYTKSKYSKERSQEISIEALETIRTSETPLTLTEIQNAAMALIGATPQKISRCLAPYVEMGLLKKTKKDGKVAYSAV